MVEQQCLKGLRALVIEDEYFIADDLKRVLKRNGADFVKLSGDIGDAIHNIKSDVFDIALVDINIHGVFTFEVADELRRRNVPFAFISGYQRSDIPRQFTDVPNWGKPYDNQKIITGIRALCMRAIEA